MSLLQRAKRELVGYATRLPPSVGLAFAQLNRSADRVFGAEYARFRRRLAEHDRGYDNTADVVSATNRALASIPYYRDRYGAGPISSIEEFRERIGFIDRQTVADYAESLVDPAIDRSRYEVCTTGGTSGKPLAFLAPRDRYVVELATMHALWSRTGYDFHMRAVIRNHHLPDGRDYLVNPITREVIFDGFRLDQASLRNVVETIERLHIRFIHCYPSHAYELALAMVECGISGVGLVFLSGSEAVYPQQRVAVEEQLGARLYSWYGHSEKLVLAGYCEHSRDFHVEPLYGHFELVDEAGRPVTEAGQVGEIVGTALHNPGMPLIRYRTDDYAEYAGDHCAACGRRVPLLRNVRGRWNGEKIFRRDGSFVTTTALNLHDNLNRVIDGLQYVQDRYGELEVLVVKSSAFSAEHERELRATLSAKLGAGVQIDVRYVAQLLRLPNGKFSHLISRVARA